MPITFAARSLVVCVSRVLAVGSCALIIAGCDDATSSQQQALTTTQVLQNPEPEAERVSLVSSAKVRLALEADVVVDDSTLMLSLNDESIAGQVVYSEQQHQISFQPDQALEPNSRYTVTLSQLETSSGDIIPAQSWSFSTADDVGSTAQWVIDSCMSEEDMSLLAAINQLRRSGYSCEQDGISAPVQPLAWHCDLAFVAQEHAADLANMGVVGSTGSNGMTPAERVNTTSVIWRGVAENSLVASSAEQSVAGATVELDQCQNLLNPALTHMGAAVALAADDDVSAIWVQLFVQQ